MKLTKLVFQKILWKKNFSVFFPLNNLFKVRGKWKNADISCYKLTPLVSLSKNPKKCQKIQKIQKLDVSLEDTFLEKPQEGGVK